MRRHQTWIYNIALRMLGGVGLSSSREGHVAGRPSGVNSCAMRASRRGNWLTTVLLVAATLGILAHVCVVPVHAHAVPIEGHGSHDDDAADHLVHTASCEAAKGGLTVAALMPIERAAELSAPLPPSLWRRSGPCPDVPTAESPPLFLLHASLLI